MKTVLVSLNNNDFLKSNMAAAIKIAREYDSHIIGLYVIPSVIVYAAPHGYGGNVHYTKLNKFHKTMAAGVEQAFEDIIQKEGVIGEWRQINAVDHFIAETIIEHGREADLIILGHGNSASLRMQPDLQFNAKIICGSGRPVLVVPTTTKPDFDIKNTIIGWDGSREAARAVFDAVPLLKMSDKVHLTSFNTFKKKGVSAHVAGEELVSALARMDVGVVIDAKKTRKRISRALIEEAKTADLLVIGAYGHSRLQEDILGGVTKTALEKMPCPVLLSN